MSNDPGSGNPNDERDERDQNDQRDLPVSNILRFAFSVLHFAFFAHSPLRPLSHFPQSHFPQLVQKPLNHRGGPGGESINPLIHRGKHGGE
jgi:hypothetical protein